MPSISTGIPSKYYEQIRYFVAMGRALQAQQPAIGLPVTAFMAGSFLAGESHLLLQLHLSLVNPGYLWD